MMRQLTAFFWRELPSYLRATNAWKTLEVFGVILDDRLEMAREALRLRWPNFDGRDESLYLIGADRQIPRGLEEPSESYADRLRAWRQTHQTRGNGYNLVEQLAAYYTHVVGEDLRIRYCERNGKMLTWEDGEIVESTYDPETYIWAGTDPEYFARWWVFIETGDVTPTAHQAFEVLNAGFKAAHITDSALVITQGDTLVWDDPEMVWDEFPTTWPDGDDAQKYEVR